MRKDYWEVGISNMLIYLTSQQLPSTPPADMLWAGYIHLEMEKEHFLYDANQNHYYTPIAGCNNYTTQNFTLDFTK